MYASTLTILHLAFLLLPITSLSPFPSPLHVPTRPPPVPANPYLWCQLPTPYNWTVIDSSHVAVTHPTTTPFYLDYTAQIQTVYKSRAAAKSSLLRACRPNHFPNITPLKVIDTTFGLGSDAITLAALHATSNHPLSIFGIEQSPAPYELSYAALDHLHSSTPHNITLIMADANTILHHHRNHLTNGTATLVDFEYVDLIYVDVMFPAKKGSASPKKGMGMLRDLLPAVNVTRDCELVDLARAIIREQGGGRVVVKRDRKSPTLSEDKPTFVVGEKERVRFDVYLY